MQDHVEVGKFGKTFHLAGEIFFFSFIVDFKVDIPLFLPIRFVGSCLMNRILLNGGKRKGFFVSLPPFKYTQKNTSSYVFKLSGFNSIDHIRTLSGIIVYTLKSYLLSLEKGSGSFYLFQLKGCYAYSNGDFIGTISNLYNFGSADLIEISLINQNNRKILIPFIKKYIKKIDVTDKKQIFFKNIEAF